MEAIAPYNLYGMDREQLEQLFVAQGLQAFRGRQIMKWLYHQGRTDFSTMTDLPRKTREWLQQNCILDLPEIHAQYESKDGTVKWLLASSLPELADNLVEMVLIPEKGRQTLCVSSQIGCMLDCSFCSTGKQGFNGNLPAADIVGQVLVANQYLAERGASVTNIVLMGMGEPLLNFAAVIGATNVMKDDLAFGLSKRRVTISTAGVVPKINELSESTDVALAISLHAPSDDLRDELVPINRKYPLETLLQACRDYVATLGPARKLVIEYTLIRDVNDRPEQARQLATLLDGLPCKINLIPFNPFPGSGYERSRQKDIYAFQTILMQSGYTTMLRTTRGDDINAACGQLVGQVRDRTKRQDRYKQRIAMTDLSAEA
ncbi:MAG TPA: 23S rRNA (adenine(2503)-C(2))-methyltransferase RlmN [Gammaproteobacteria bacterium]|nr:23S rRNA (adenine(2503)-C(2))-methyltransferase RlmN [Gammaproteobacteria bacterium]|tara:strand:+ start:3768 stop:4892 length:1125 start_codon:yes stop_codon:yes gene_type:complete